MEKLINELSNLYIVYENLYSLGNKINLIFKLDEIESKIFNVKNHNIVGEYILKSLNKKYIFDYSRKIYILSKLNLNYDLIGKYENICYQNIVENLNSNRKDLCTSYSILGFKTFSKKNKNFFKILLENKYFYYLYQKELIISFSKVSYEEEDFVFLYNLLKKFPQQKEYIFWAIGNFSTPQKNHLIRKNIINKYLKYSINLLNKNELDDFIFENFLYSLIEISFIPTRIEGEYFNKLLHLLFKNKYSNPFSLILIKVLNNNILSEEEMGLLKAKRNLY